MTDKGDRGKNIKQKPSFVFGRTQAMYNQQLIAGNKELEELWTLHSFIGRIQYQTQPDEEDGHDCVTSLCSAEDLTNQSSGEEIGYGAPRSRASNENVTMESLKCHRRECLSALAQHFPAFIQLWRDIMAFCCYRKPHTSLRPPAPLQRKSLLLLPEFASRLL
jgi:hypothetical protein